MSLPVSYTVRIGNAPLLQQGFGTPIFLAYHTVTGNLVDRFVGDDILSDMVTAGFTENSPLYIAVSNFLQYGSKEIVIGRLTSPFTQRAEFTPINVAEGYVYRLPITVNGVTETATYTVQNGDAVADITAGLTAAVTAFTTVDVGAADNTTKITLTEGVPGTGWLLDLSDFNLGIDASFVDTTANAVTSIATQLTNIETALDASVVPYYAFFFPAMSVAIADLVSTWISTRKDKLAVISTSDTAAGDSGDTSDILSNMAGDNNNYIAAHFDAVYGPYGPMAASLMGWFLPTTPGSSTTANVPQLRGSFVEPVKASGGFFATLEAKKATVYRPLNLTQASTRGGFVSGEYGILKNTRDLQFAKARLEEALTNHLNNNPVVLYTAGGLGTVRTVMQSVVDLLVTLGIASPGTEGSETDPPPVVFVPDIEDISVSDKANAILNNTYISFVLGGAIHKITGEIVANF